MKWNLSFLWLWFASPLILAQSPAAASPQPALHKPAIAFQKPGLNTSSASQASVARFVGERGPNSRTWFKVTASQNVSGRTHTRTNRAYVEIATGICYRDENGNWADSKELIEPAVGGGVAVMVGTK